MLSKLEKKIVTLCVCCDQKVEQISVTLMIIVMFCVNLFWPSFFSDVLVGDGKKSIV